MLNNELSFWPGVTARPENGGKHVKLILTFKDVSRFVTCQRSASEGRGLRNTISDMRETLRAMGAARSA